MIKGPISALVSGTAAGVVAAPQGDVKSAIAAAAVSLVVALCHLGINLLLARFGGPKISNQIGGEFK